MELARNASALATGNAPDILQQCVAMAGDILERSRDRGLTSPQIAHLILSEIKHLSGVPDPFQGFKETEMAHAREVFSRLDGNAVSDLRAMVALAALGNSVDFFRDPKTALSESPRQFAEGITFFKNDADRLEAFLARKPEMVLYFTDNAGEVYFDLPLFDFIKGKAEKTVLVVKGGPALNDLTREELSNANLEGRFDKVMDTGSDAPGIDWGLAPEELTDLVRSADLIISKGMANFETIFPQPLPTPVFYLFKVKCKVIQSYLDAPEGSFMAMWRDKGSLPEDA